MSHATDKPAADVVKLDVPPGQVLLGGVLHYIRADGARMPASTVADSDKLEDQTVRAAIAGALAMSAAMAAFKSGEFENFGALGEVLASQYNAPKGGAKGNVSYVTIDGLLKVVVAVQDRIVFGAQLQVAKAILDELIVEWGRGAKAELVAIIQNAFSVDSEKQINRGALITLMRVQSDDERWNSAMKAIKDSMRIEGSKRYMRFYQRPNVDAAWSAIPLDISSV